MEFLFSFIVPVYNRPNEVRELLESLEKQTYAKPYEIVIVEDGSTISSEAEVACFSQLPISYYVKENSGPGDSRNYGMGKAKGNYFIVLDSDCILPPHYLVTAEKSLQTEYVDCYGGPDAAHTSFSTVQKAINYAMTSLWTTGGIRGGKKSVDRFQPRSFNMGISKKAFEKTGGYGNIHPGEDPDLTIRIWNNGFTTKLIPEAYVYHKRRIDWSKFYIQVNKFGMVRPILNKWHPETVKITYWFPTLFCLGFIGALFAIFIGFPWFMYGYGLYFGVVFFDSLWKNKNTIIALLSVVAVGIQFVGYGSGFIKSTLVLGASNRTAQELFPKLFFKV